MASEGEFGGNDPTTEEREEMSLNSGTNNDSQDVSSQSSVTPSGEETSPNSDTGNATQDASSGSNSTSSGWDFPTTLSLRLSVLHYELCQTISKTRKETTLSSTKLFFASRLLESLCSEASLCEVGGKTDEILQILASLNKTLDELDDKLESAEELVKALKKDDDPVAAF